MRTILAVVMVGSACAPSHAEQRRDEVRAWQEKRPTGVTHPGVGPWRWGSSVTDVLMQTEHAWVNEDGTEVSAPVQLGQARGLATFGFRSGQLVRIEVLVPNRAGAEDEVRQTLKRILGGGEPPALTQGQAAGLVVLGILTTLAVASTVLAVAGRGSVSIPATNLYPWYTQPRDDDSARTVEWRTADTLATLTVETAAIAVTAQARP